MADLSQAIFGLVGVVIGGGITTAGALWTQRTQLKAAVRTEARTRELAASSAIMDALGRLLYLENTPEADTSAGTTQPGRDTTRDRLLLQIATAAQDLRHVELRTRIDQAHHILFRHAAAWNMIGQPENRSRQIACAHAVECVGAFRRGEDLPPKPPAFVQTITAIEDWQPAARRAQQRTGLAT